MSPALRLCAGRGVGKRAFASLVLLLAISVAFVSRANAQEGQSSVIAERDYEFAAQLIEKGFLDLAELQIEALSKQKGIDIQMRNDIKMLSVLMNVGRAAKTADAADRVALLEDALNQYNEYLKSTPKSHPKYRESLFGKALTQHKLASAYDDLSEKVTGDEQLKAKKKAVIISDEAVKFYEDYSQKLQEDIDKQLEKIDDESLSKYEKDQARMVWEKLAAQQRKTDSGATNLIKWKLKLYPPNSKERFDYMTVAVEKLSNLSERHENWPEGISIGINWALMEGERLTTPYFKFFSGDAEAVKASITEGRDNVMYKMFLYINVLDRIPRAKPFAAWATKTRAEVLTMWQIWKPSSEFVVPPEDTPLRRPNEYNFKPYAEAIAVFTDLFSRYGPFEANKQTESMMKDARLKFALALVYARKCDEALEQCNKVMQSGDAWKQSAQEFVIKRVSPNCPLNLSGKELVEKGKYLMQQRQYIKAQESFRDAISKSKSSGDKSIAPYAYFYYGKAEFFKLYNVWSKNRSAVSAKQFANARGILEKVFGFVDAAAAKKDEELGKMLKECAQILFNSAKLEFISTPSKNKDTYKMLGDAAQLYQKWDPTADVDYLMGTVMENSSQYGEARKAYGKFVEKNKLSDKFPEVLVSIARCWFREARETFRLAEKNKNDQELKKKSDELMKIAEARIKEGMEQIDKLTKVTPERKQSYSVNLTSLLLQIYTLQKHYQDVLNTCDKLLEVYNKDPKFYMESIVKMTERRFYAQVELAEENAAKKSGDEKHLALISELNKENGAGTDFLKMVELAPDYDRNKFMAYKLMTSCNNAFTTYAHGKKKFDRQMLDPYAKKSAMWTREYYKLTRKDKRAWPFNPATLSGGKAVPDDKPYYLQKLRYVEDRLCWEGFYPSSELGDDAVSSVNPEDDDLRIQLLNEIISLMDQAEPPARDELEKKIGLLQPLTSSEKERKLIFALRDKYRLAINSYFGKKDDDGNVEVVNDFFRTLSILKSIKRAIKKDNLSEDLVSSKEYQLLYKATDLQVMRLTYQESRLLALYKKIGRWREAVTVLEELVRYYGSDEAREEMAYISCKDEVGRYDEASEQFEKLLKSTSPKIIPYSVHWFRLKYMLAFCQYKLFQYKKAIEIINVSVSQFKGSDKVKREKLEGEVSSEGKPSAKDTSRYKKGKDDPAYADDLELWRREQKRVKMGKHNYFELANDIAKDNNVPQEIKKELKVK